MALHAVIPSSQRHSDALVEQRPLSWDDIGGLEDVKLQLQQVKINRTVLCFLSEIEAVDTGDEDQSH